MESFPTTRVFHQSLPTMLGAKSLSNDLRKDQQAIQQTSRPSDKMDASVEKPNSNVFSSMEFGRFLNNEFHTKDINFAPSKDAFLSKDSALPAFDSSLFKSKDSFSGMYASKEWEMKYPQEDIPSNPPDHGKCRTKSFKAKNMTECGDDVEEAELVHSEALKSGDWMLLENLGSHVDVQYTTAIFSNGTSETSSGMSNPGPGAFMGNEAVPNSSNDIEEPELVSSEVLKSGEWMPFNTLGNHVDVVYTAGMFSRMTSDAASINGMELPPSRLPPVKTEWDQLFMSQLIPPASPVVRELSVVAQPEYDAPPEPSLASVIAPTVAFEGLIAPQPFYPVAAPAVPAGAPQASVPTLDFQHDTQASNLFESQQGQKRKRKRAPRKKVVPSIKVYVEPTENDVLMGRGGKSNHHPGNKRYREEVENLKQWYNDLQDKDEKTDLSQCLVDYVHANGARFLEHDDFGWYVIENVVARRKASQALREDSDPEKRAAKRKRFLEKRAREQASRQQGQAV